MALDAGIRIGPANDRFNLAWNGGGAAAVTLTHGVYTSLAQLLAEVQTRLRLVDASWTVTHAAGVVSLTWSTTSAVITWTRPALRDWLGWTATISTSSGAATAPSRCPGYFPASQPWDDPKPVGWDVRLLRARHRHGEARSFQRGLRRRFGVMASVAYGELPAFRAALAPWLRGIPGTLHRGDDAAWSWTEWRGRVVAQLDVEEYSDDWTDRGRMVRVEVPLELVEYTA